MQPRLVLPAAALAVGLGAAPLATQVQHQPGGIGFWKMEPRA